MHVHVKLHLSLPHGLPLSIAFESVTTPPLLALLVCLLLRGSRAHLRDRARMELGTNLQARPKQFYVGRAKFSQHGTGARLARPSRGMPPQKHFGFRPLLERFWWVLVVCSSRLSMESICALAWASGWALTVRYCVRRATRKT